MGKFVPVRSVKKALDLLDLIIETNVSGECSSLAALVNHLGMPRSTVHNLLTTMVACGYVELSERGIYIPGYKCRQLLHLGRLANPELVEEVGQTLQQFTDMQHESCMLVILVNGERAVVCFVDCKQAVRLSHPTVEKRTFFEKPTGRMLAAMALKSARHIMPGFSFRSLRRRSISRQLARLFAMTMVPCWSL